MHEDRSTKEEQNLVAQDNTVTGEVTRSLGLDVDVGGDDTVEVTPSDDHAEDEGALERALGVVDDPRESI